MGKLVIVPTPIGNLKDITFRAVQTLQEVDIILAEDTRNSAKLLAHYSIDTPMKAYHMHNEHKTISKWVENLQAGKSIALISDAGTPGVSDPGFLLVRECVKHGQEVECLPGATALIPALVLSALPCERFVFHGFLPHKKGRKTRLQSMAHETKTMVFYESPYRILKTLEQFSETFGSDRQASVSRELSKKFEETIRGSVADLITHFKEREPKGEFVIVIEGKKS
ncbi:MAG: 16S rRNA (cytidine(1402)-2'-O)-methyltransferase [Bacteroidota bacterium]|nr:16S rRNA (cytidine(1402)-2'-O)-methyltransferase [Bacteroidota bacterium]